MAFGGSKVAERRSVKKATKVVSSKIAKNSPKALHRMVKGKSSKTAKTTHAVAKSSKKIVGQRQVGSHAARANVKAKAKLNRKKAPGGGALKRSRRRRRSRRAGSRRRRSKSGRRRRRSRRSGRKRSRRRRRRRFDDDE